MLRQQIHPDAAVLDALHVVHPWVPNSKQIRPSNSTLEKKLVFLSECTSVVAHVWKIHFDCDEDPIEPGSRLVAQPFPYSTFGRHMLCWFVGKSSCDWTNDEITKHITEHTLRLGIPQFVWYANPKKSVIHARLHHVQVFCPN